MSKSEKNTNNEQLQSIIGLSKFSAKKSYYPSLQEKIKELEDEKLKYERIFSNALHGIFQSDLGGKIIVANPAMINLCGYNSEEELIKNVNVKVDLFLDCNDYNIINQNFSESESIYEFETKIINKNKKIINVAINATIQKNDSNEFLEFFVQDISDRKLAEIELQEREREQRNLINGMNETVWVIDFSGKIIDVNKQVENILGYTRKELLEIGLEGIDGSYTSLEIQKLAKSIQLGEIQVFESTHVTKQGKIIPVEINSSIISYHGKNEILCVIRDITERKKTELKLLEKDDLLTKVGRIAKIGGWEFDVATFEGTWTDEVARIHDLDPSKKTNVSTSLSFYPEQDRKIIEEAIKNAITKFESYDLELELHTEKNRKWIKTIGEPVIENNKVVKVRGTIQDITARKEAEIKLKENETRLAKIFNSTSELQLLTNIEDHKNYYIAAINDKYIKQVNSYGINISRESMIGISFWELFKILGLGKDILEQTLEKYRKVADTGVSIAYTENFKVLDKDYYSESILTPVNDNNGKCKYVLYNSRDVTEQKIAEIALQKSEEHYRSLFEEAPVPLWEEDFSEVKNEIDILKKENVKDFGKFFIENPDFIIKLSQLIKINNVNKEVLNLHNAKSKEELFEGLANIFTEESYYAFREEVIAIAEGKRESQFEGKVKTLDGIEKDVLLKWAVVPGYESTIKKVFISTIDITKRKQTEKALRESEERFKSLHNASFGGIMIHDNGIVLECNQGLSDMTGYSMEELIGMDGFNFITKDSYDIIHEKINSGNEEPYEAVGLRKNGEKFPIRLEARNIPYKGKMLRTVEIRDITDEKQAELELKKSEEKFRSAFEESAIAMVLEDDKGQYIKVNKAMTSIFGYSENELLTMDIRKLTFNEDADKNFSLIKKLWSGELSTASFIKKYIHKDGHTIWGRTNLSPVKDEKGDIYLLLGQMEDITEQRIAEISLQKSEEHYRSLFENMGEGYALHQTIMDENGNVINYEVIQVNKALLEIFELPEEELLNKRAGDLIPATKSEIEKRIKKYGEISQNGGELYEEVFDSRTKKWLRIHTFSFERNKFAAITTDITEQKNSIEKLKENERLLKEVGEMTKVGRWETDVETQKGTWSEEVAKIYDVDYLDISVEEVFSFFKGSSKEKAHEVFRDIVENEKQIDTEFEIVTANGVEKWIRVIAKPELLNGKVIKILGALQDITKQKEAENKIIENKRLLQEVGIMGKIGGWEFDVDTFEGKWSEEIARIYDVDYLEVSVERVISFYKESYKDMVNDVIKDIIENKKSYDLELEIITAKGIEKWIRVIAKPILLDGNVKKVHGTIQDITKQKNSEKRIRENEEELKKQNKYIQMILDNFPVGIATNEIDSNKVKYINSKFAEIYGWLPEDFPTTLDFFEKVFPDITYREELHTKIMTDLASGDINRMRWEDLKITTKNGETRRVLAANIPLLDQNIMVSTVQDITERKNAEDELEKYRLHLEELVEERTKELELTNKKLISSNKDLESFSYSVSHDLRAPLRAINGFTNILMEDYVTNLDDEAIRIGTVIKKNSQKMGNLIDDLLTFSRIGRSEMNYTNIDMKSMVNSIYHEATTPEIREIISIRIGDLEYIVGDTSMMRQVWMNLISNAIKFSSKKESPEISFNCSKESNQIIYSIKDNGSGFNMEYKDKLFGVFQRLHSERDFEGTGVGLALVQRIISRHGGKVWGESEVNKGATFYFSLPIKIFKLLIYIFNVWSLK